MRMRECNMRLREMNISLEKGNEGAKESKAVNDEKWARLTLQALKRLSYWSDRLAQTQYS